ncbi:MAG: carboxypeptidase regulatory-like domain-containing protein [Acidobacteria bacterium]|nr:carboxypeptidase regulatory-like domain-containing protein [Acidobacteriota bacterium]
MRKPWCRPALSILLSAVGVAGGWAAPSAPAELTIVILEGEEGVNVLKKKTAVRPVVEVRDRNKAPVAGATVVFLLPQYGPGGTFLDGGKMMSVTTDASGRAAASAIQPSGTGAFKINVTASFQGQTASAAISQANMAAAAAGGVSATTIGIIAGVAAAAAVGIGVGLAGGKKESAAPADTAPRATIGVGSGPVFGPPR